MGFSPPRSSSGFFLGNVYGTSGEGRSALEARPRKSRTSHTALSGFFFGNVYNVLGEGRGVDAYQVARWLASPGALPIICYRASLFCLFSRPAGLGFSGIGQPPHL